jgi:hypothetical protein
VNHGKKTGYKHPTIGLSFRLLRNNAAFGKKYQERISNPTDATRRKITSGLHGITPHHFNVSITSKVCGTRTI